MIDINDPRITAYALGELSESERIEFEKEIKNDADIRREIEEIRSFGNLLRKELEEEPLPAGGQILLHRGKKTSRRSIFMSKWLQVAAVLLVLTLVGLGELVLPNRIGKATRDDLAWEQAGDMEIPSNGAKHDIVDTHGRTNLQGEAHPILDLTKQYVPSDGSVSIADLSQTEGKVPAAKGQPEESMKSGLQSFYSYSDLKGGDDFAVLSDHADSDDASLINKDLCNIPASASVSPEGVITYGLGYPARPSSQAVMYSTLSTAQPMKDDWRFQELSPEDSPLTFVVAGEETGASREGYDSIVENDFRRVVDEPLSTFSVDVDTASYSNVRRMLNQGTLPPRGAVRIEEFVNYFDYRYSEPHDDSPFAANMELAKCPWQPEHRLVRIGLKGKEMGLHERPACNLVFLIDVSGSMNAPNKLPLLKESFEELVWGLSGKDKVAMVVYAGASGLVLSSTPASNTTGILDALDRLNAGGSTNGGAGIRLAYDVARENFIDGGVNRVILATDGDFNVGTTSQSELADLVEQKAKDNVFLSVLGFGMGNYKDDMLEKLADKGNGNYAYIDTLNEAKKVLGEQLTGTLVTIAKDVKIQVEFNPLEVAAYRLVGYENRVMKNEDFNDDTKDAGEIGAGHTVTAFYEVIPAGQHVPSATVDDLKYQTKQSYTDAALSGDMLTLKLRYKQPDGDTSLLKEFSLRNSPKEFSDATDDFRFAASVAEFALLLRDSKYKGTSSFQNVLATADESKGPDQYGYRGEFIDLVKKAESLQPQPSDAVSDATGSNPE